MIALTATATRMTRNGIIGSLFIENSMIFKSSPNRPNIRYCVIQRQPDAVAKKAKKGKKAKACPVGAGDYLEPRSPSMEQLNSILTNAELESKCGIIYCSTKLTTDKVAEFLQKRNLSASDNSLLCGLLNLQIIDKVYHILQYELITFSAIYRTNS
jgi:superfamily II DNA helicase RecQ